MSGVSIPFDHLVVLHSHWRPGGVRRVVELALPSIVRALSPWLRKVTLLSGGKSHERLILPPLGVETVFHIDPAFDYLPAGYFEAGKFSERIKKTLEGVVSGGDPSRVLVWFHNPALAKNPLVCAEVGALSRRADVGLLMHHHDFWCAGRWERWETLQACGFDTPASAAAVLFGAGARCRHVTINSIDFKTLAPSFLGMADHLPNPLVQKVPDSNTRSSAARAWINEKTGGRPLWISPTRLLRRKNLLEGIILARWLRPDAVFAIASGAFSSGERRYARILNEVAKESDGRVIIGLLDDPDSPEVEQVLSLAEAVILTSVQEGFGMGFVEAAVAGVPVIARRLPHVKPDMEALGFMFPHLYDEVLIAPDLFDRKAEAVRQSVAIKKNQAGLRIFNLRAIPACGNAIAGAVPFSRLTVEGQREVMRHPADKSWSICKELNPWLVQIASSPLKATPWPQGLEGSIEHYATSFVEIVQSMPTQGFSGKSEAAQFAIARAALNPGEYFPLLI